MTRRRLPSLHWSGSTRWCRNPTALGAADTGRRRDIGAGNLGDDALDRAAGRELDDRETDQHDSEHASVIISSNRLRISCAHKAESFLCRQCCRSSDLRASPACGQTMLLHCQGPLSMRSALALSYPPGVKHAAGVGFGLTAGIPENLSQKRDIVRLPCTNAAPSTFSGSQHPVKSPRRCHKLLHCLPACDNLVSISVSTALFFNALTD